MCRSAGPAITAAAVVAVCCWFCPPSPASGGLGISMVCAVTTAVCEAAVAFAATSNNTSQLQWLLDQKLLVLGPELYAAALSSRTRVASGHLTVIKWLREVADCPWDTVRLVTVAVERGQLTCLQYLQQHREPFTLDQLKQLHHTAVIRRFDGIADWLKTQQAEASD